MQVYPARHANDKFQVGATILDRVPSRAPSAIAAAAAPTAAPTASCPDTCITAMQRRDGVTTIRGTPPNSPACAAPTWRRWQRRQAGWHAAVTEIGICTKEDAGVPPHLPRDRNKEHQIDVGPRRSSPKDEAVLENGERQGGGGALGKGASDPGTIQRRISR